jgi:hypothetical protein
MIREPIVDDVESDSAGAYVTMAELRRDFRLTDAHLARLGQADRSEPVPGDGPPHVRQVYARERVERWVAENRALIDDSDARRALRDARREREHQAAESQRRETWRQVVAAIRQSDLRELPPLAYVRARVASPRETGLDANDRIAIDMAILNYALANLTGYPELARLLNRLDAGFQLAAAVRIHVCCRVIRHYQLALDPLDATFQAGAKGKLPPAFASGDPKAVADAILASEA